MSLDEIDRLISERRFKEAAEVADRIDWTRIRGTQTLCKISDLYKINKRYRESRDLLITAYEKNPASRKIIYSLCELELKLNNYIHALQLYNAFINVAPKDSDRYLLQYKLYKKQEVNVMEQIAVLEEFQQHDFRERWAYELATLYQRSGDIQSCIRQCDEIVAYFGDGRFVVKALELKRSMAELTPQQEERLNLLRKGGTVVPASMPAAQTPASGADGSTDPAGSPGSGDTDPLAASAETAPAAAGVPDRPFFQGDAAGGSESGSPAGGSAARERNRKESSGLGSEQFSDRSEEESTGRQSAEQPVQDEAETSAAGQSGDSRELKEAVEAKQEAAESKKEAAEPKQEPVDPEQDKDEPEQDEEEPDASEPAGTPEEYTDTLLNDVHMEETIAQGMREIGDYDSVLAQETSGQLAMVMEEEETEESQIEGQRNLEQIMSEWEKIRKESEQKRLADARRRVLERSDAAKRQLYGDDYAVRSADSGMDPGKEEYSVPDFSSSVQQDSNVQSEMGKTRSWRKDDVESGLKKNRR